MFLYVRPTGGCSECLVFTRTFGQIFFFWHVFQCDIRLGICGIMSVGHTLQQGIVGMLI